MQEVSIVAWRKFSTLDNRDAFGAWACMIARYELLMARRRYARDRLVLSEDLVELMADEGAQEMSIRHQQLNALDACLAELPSERREIALAAYNADTSIRRLATELNRSEASLYQLLYRIRKQLYTCMSQTTRGTS